ncbi:MAG TPA: LacI family DNA-binding transcriptional regulator [Acidothermaceae bacterium]|nr:LacI family DNA-binding transcriptional regulator [Acidothermaceae bacterium]
MAQVGVDLRDRSVPATVESVARHARVSRQTVSNAINAPDRLRPETLARVLASIDALGYRPNRVARSLRTRSTRMLGYRIEPAREGVSSPVLDRFVHALAATARDAGYHIVLFTSDDETTELGTYEDLIRTNAVDAFVLSGTRYDDPRQRWLADRGAPSVAFGRPWGAEGDPGPWVDVDGAAGTSQVVDHLVELGHRRIGFVGSPPDKAVGDDRLDGWRRAMRKHGLPTRDLWLRGVDSLESGASAAGRLLERAEPPSAIVCASDTLAAGCLHRAHELGQRVGTDLALVGFDDSPVAGFLQPGLSSVRQPLEEVGREIVRLLTSVLAGERPRTPHVLLTPTLVVRESSSFTPAAIATRRKRRP